MTNILRKHMRGLQNKIQKYVYDLWSHRFCIDIKFFIFSFFFPPNLCMKATKWVCLEKIVQWLQKQKQKNGIDCKKLKKKNIKKEIKIKNKKSFWLHGKNWNILWSQQNMTQIHDELIPSIYCMNFMYCLLFFDYRKNVHASACFRLLWKVSDQKFSVADQYLCHFHHYW